MLMMMMMMMYLQIIKTNYKKTNYVFDKKLVNNVRRNDVKIANMVCFVGLNGGISTRPRI